MKQSPSLAASTGTRYRVLIVHPQEADRQFLDTVLKQPGYETVLAADGREALERSGTHGPFDLLVTDFGIPGMPGDELARRLRSSDPGLKILYLSDPDDRLFDERTALWEEEAFVEKPVTAQGVLEAAALMLVGHLPAPRPVRVSIPGARVRFKNRVAELVKLSVTGALINDVEALPIDSRWPIALELPSDTIRLTARVVSCDPVRSQPPGAAPSGQAFSTALAFVDPPSSRRRLLQRIVQQAYQA
jgi:CheY-like chemotaxis protein